MTSQRISSTNSESANKVLSDSGMKSMTRPTIAASNFFNLSHYTLIFNVQSSTGYILEGHRPLSTFSFLSSIMRDKNIIYRPFSEKRSAAPLYHRIILPMGFGRLPLRSDCDSTNDPILMNHTSNERRGMELNTA